MTTNNLLTVQYQQTAQSTNNDALGMREMQARAYAQRDAQYLLLKAPPASGKSRALMFLGLDKLHAQGLRKVIVAVPEMSIGASFSHTALSEHGFPYDWEISRGYNLCSYGGETSGGKVAAFKRFLTDSDASIMLCTHATLRIAYQDLSPSDFDGTLLAIDEFHHASAGEESRLGELIDGVMHGSNAHIIAMTGSYFRGDAVPILLPEDEAKFTQVTYSYYEQLNGYRYLKSLGIGYHFYTERYMSALGEVLDTSKKTILHIPNVNSMESTKDKYSEVDHIIDIIGEFLGKDPDTGVMSVRDRATGRVLKVADLVDDDPKRGIIQEYLSQIDGPDDMDIIIALGMAKEGFDWPWCEHVLTVGYRSSLTEIVQIIGRATRDAKGKTHAQFTNLIAQPAAESDDVTRSVNNMLKAITVSLLMEQVLAPSINFKPRSRLIMGEELEAGTVIIDDGKTPMSDAVMAVIQNADNIKAALLQESDSVAATVSDDSDESVILKATLPRVIAEKHPHLSDEEVGLVAEAMFISLAVPTLGGIVNEEDIPEGAQVIGGSESGNNEASSTAEPSSSPEGHVTTTIFGTQDGFDIEGMGGAPTSSDPLACPATDTDDESEPSGGTTPPPPTPPRGKPAPSKQFVQVDNKFINIEHLNIDLISHINPFQGAYEVLSKSVTPDVLKSIQNNIRGRRASISEDEAVILWPRIHEFMRESPTRQEPSMDSSDPYERRLGEALNFLRLRAQERKAEERLARETEDDSSH